MKELSFFTSCASQRSNISLLKLTHTPRAKYFDNDFWFRWIMGTLNVTIWEMRWKNCWKINRNKNSIRWSVENLHFKWECREWRGAGIFQRQSQLISFCSAFLHSCSRRPLIESFLGRQREKFVHNFSNQFQWGEVFHSFFIRITW
jgi:hypothetical protein